MNDADQILSGSIPISIGIPSFIRIPVPGTGGLCLEFSPRGHVPKSGSTSTLFFQDKSGKRHLRLDYGYNVKSKTVDFHWNQAGTFENFGIGNHSTVGNLEASLYKASKYYKYAGRVFVVLGASVDAISIVVSSNPLRRASAVVSGWALAWAGCKLVGGAGALLGSAASPVGTAVGGIGGCIIGGYLGYEAGSAFGGAVYDWGQAIFTPLPEVAVP